MWILVIFSPGLWWNFICDDTLHVSALFDKEPSKQEWYNLEDMLPRAELLTFCHLLKEQVEPDGQHYLKTQLLPYQSDASFQTAISSSLTNTQLTSSSTMNIFGLSSTWNVTGYFTILSLAKLPPVQFPVLYRLYFSPLPRCWFYNMGISSALLWITLLVYVMRQGIITTRRF